MRKTIAAIAAAAAITASASAAELRIQLEINGKPPETVRVWVSGIPDGKPPGVPTEYDPEHVEITDPENTLIIKVIDKQDLTDVIRILRNMAGVK